MENPNGRDFLAFALDIPHEKEALSFVAQLSEYVGVFKIGLELFLSQGPSIVKKVRNAAPQSRIFLDMKLHDVPETVGRAAAAVAPLLSSAKGDFLTVHAADGHRILQAAVTRAPNVHILAITVLTSVEGEFANLVKERATTALNAGCRGVVTSGHEVKEIKNLFQNKLFLVTPGIRPEQNQIQKDDQRRIVTPKEAICAGADLLVVGRPIREAKEPKQAAKQIVEEINAALQERKTLH